MRYVLMIALLVLAGCNAGDGSLRLLVSDAPADIGDFEELLVTFEEARIFPAEDTWEIIRVNETVDLTRLQGPNATLVGTQDLPAGTYEKIELYVLDVQGTVNGSEADIFVPSGRLQITKPFTIDPEETTTFVFDIDVVRRGQGFDYNLLPNIADSGTDVEIAEV